MKKDISKFIRTISLAMIQNKSDSGQKESETQYLAMELKSLMVVSIFHTGGRTEGDARPSAFFKAIFLSL